MGYHAVLKNEDNVLTIEVAGYNSNGFYVINQPSFVQAEIVSEEKVLAATSVEGAAFVARIMTERVQKVERYNYQRSFVEAYRFNEQNHAWRASSFYTGSLLTG